VARQWSAPAVKASPQCCNDDGHQDKTVLSFDEFLEQATINSFTISAMAFQDAWNLDLERLAGCCIHVAAPDGRLIPFCAYNLTSINGRGLYRRKS